MSVLLLSLNTDDTTGSPIATSPGWSGPLTTQIWVYAAIDYIRVKIYTLSGDGWGTVNARVMLDYPGLVSEGSIPFNSVPVGSPGDWVTIPMSAGDIGIGRYVSVQLQQEYVEGEMGEGPPVVFWRRQSAQYNYMRELWGTPYLPAKPTNPTPSNGATGQRLSLASFIWEKGSW